MQEVLSGHDLLRDTGLRNLQAIYANLGTAPLLEQAIRRREGILAANGALVVKTGQFTGRSPRDKYIVREAATESSVDWGAVNQPIDPARFERIYARLLAYLEGQEVFAEDLYGGADPEYTLPVRVITQLAWHALFARQLLIRRHPRDPRPHEPE
ncbi:MAG: phosphoenolpyruvate carboxykinase (ATP), partial [Acidobacteria bacterium]|nr:phosphoenolpyruvate carboxykinase (ATP) [Acidobacteriota bacterium]